MTCIGPWPLHPIGERMKMIDDDLPITFLYGEGMEIFSQVNFVINFLSLESWTSKQYGYIFKEHRDIKFNSHTNVYIVPKAGHHIHADNPEEFHKIVLNACKILRSNR